MGEASSVSPTRVETAYALLAERLARGVYVPGYRIVIKELVAETGISSIPWREAIRQLEAAGRVEIVRNVGARVSVFDVGARDRSVQVLARLEGYVTAVAGRRMDQRALDEARGVNAEVKAAALDLDPGRLEALDRKFHFAFYGNCGDSHLLRLVTNEWDRVELARRGVPPSALERSGDVIREHEELLALVEHGGSFEEVERSAAGHRLNILEPWPRRSAREPN